MLKLKVGDKIINVTSLSPREGKKAVIIAIEPIMGFSVGPDQYKVCYGNGDIGWGNDENYKKVSNKKYKFLEKRS